MTGSRPFAEIGESIGDALLKRAGRVSARVQERRSLAADLLESESAYRIVFDAPGATASDVQVRFDDGAVAVRVDRFRDFHEGFEMRFPGRGLSLDGRVELPESAVVESDAATATLTQRGTLEIHLPKGEGAPERTEIEDEEDPLDLDIESRVTTVEGSSSVESDDAGDAPDDAPEEDAGLAGEDEGDGSDDAPGESSADDDGEDPAESASDDEE